MQCVHVHEMIKKQTFQLFKYIYYNSDPFHRIDIVHSVRQSDSLANHRARGLRPLIPHDLSCPFIRHQGRETYDLPCVVEVARQSKAYSYNSKLSPHEFFKILASYSGVKLFHIVLDIEDGGGPTRITHTPRTKGYFMLRRGMLDECVGNHFS